MRHLIVLQNKLNITYDPSLTLVDIIKEIKDAFRNRKHIKKIVENLSLEYFTQFADAKEAAGEVKAASYLCSLKHTEFTRRLYRNIRQMGKKLKGGSTTYDTVLQPDGTYKELTSH